MQILMYAKDAMKIGHCTELRVKDDQIIGCINNNDTILMVCRNHSEAKSNLVDVWNRLVSEHKAGKEAILIKV